MTSQPVRTVTAGLLGLLLTGSLLAAPALAQSNNAPEGSRERTQPWDRQINNTATQADAWFDSYKFRSGETLERLKIHYATLGAPHRNANGDIDNAVLVLHWTGADGRALLSPTYMKALFDPGRPLDANRYYLIFADSVGHGQSSKPSDGLKGKVSQLRLRRHCRSPVQTRHRDSGHQASSCHSRHVHGRHECVAMG